MKRRLAVYFSVDYDDIFRSKHTIVIEKTKVKIDR